MRPIRLDALTADRLLSGEVSSDDAPPGYAGVAHLLEAAGAGLGADESMREPATVAVKLTAWPDVDGFGPLSVKVVVVAGLTTNSKPGSVSGAPM